MIHYSQAHVIYVNTTEAKEIYLSWLFYQIFWFIILSAVFLSRK